ncbi:hypothetical protein G7046_g8740 [Stylonectria norvegica]|nr:hypothetical protein G7046_g8740 [Stylonectria norvegica]
MVSSTVNGGRTAKYLGFRSPSKSAPASDPPPASARPSRSGHWAGKALDEAVSSGLHVPPKLQLVLGRHVSYQRSRHVTTPGTSLIKIEGVDTTEGANFYLGKKVAFVYRASKEIRGTKIRVIWGKVTRPHGNSGVVRAKFTSPLPTKSFGASCSIEKTDSKACRVKLAQPSLAHPYLGSAPYISGQVIFKLIGTILYVAMIPRYSLNLPTEAKAIKDARCHGRLAEDKGHGREDEDRGAESAMPAKPLSPSSSRLSRHKENASWRNFK